MPSRRDTPSPSSAEAPRMQQAPLQKQKANHDCAQPSAGRTGKLGAKAERPDENRARKTGDGGAEPERKGKAPSPAAKEREGREEELPQPVRDATG